MIKNRHEGIVNGIMAYSLWGVLPVYWKFLDHVPAGEVLANRILWSFLFMLVLLIVSRRLQDLKSGLLEALSNKRALIALIGVSILISINWLIFIWAVSMERIVETSLGYYINPLVSIVLGVLVLKEKLTKSHVMAFFLALAGVLFLTVSYGKFPWIAFGLALSFGFYGLLKKMLPFDSAIGLTMETLAVMPAALLYIVILFVQGKHGIFAGSGRTDFLLIASGVATAIPLLLFAKGVQKIPLYLMGFLQYLAPTMMLILGIFLYREPFGVVQLIAFTFIWSALLLVSFSSIKWANVNKKQPDRIA